MPLEHHVPETAPLKGIRVVELANGVAAAYCARQFAQWGADVVVLEPEGGSPLRTMHPRASARDGSEPSLLWTNIAANKRTLDLAALSAADADALLAAADVFVTDYRDAALAKIGALETIAKRHPALCVVSVTSFGFDGPYAGYTGSELVVQALSGYLGLNGESGRPPLQAPGRLTGYAIGVGVFVAALAAYLGCQATGHGDLVEVSEMECLAAIVPYLRVQYMGRDKVREGGTEVGVRVLPCADGWVSFMPISEKDRDAIGDALGVAKADWPAGLDKLEYADKVAVCTEFLSRYTMKLTADEIFHRMARRAVTCGKVFGPKQLLEAEQLMTREYFRSIAHPALGDLTFVGAPAALRHAAPVEPVVARPCAARTELGWDTPRAAPVAPAAPSDLPLKGVRVLDLTQAWIGPFATLLLADLGAEVVKIESHRRPDVWRTSGHAPFEGRNVEPVNRSHNFNSVNRNKRDLALDLRSPDGKALFLELVKDADIVAENYTARVMDRFGLGYGVLSSVKPDIIMASSSGFGKAGPWSAYRTNGSAIEALGGWDFLHRYRDGAPLLMGFYQADAICGLQFASMMLISLIQRRAGGNGNFIDGSMLEAAVSYLGEQILEASLGQDPVLPGNRNPDMAPHGVYQCRGNDRWIAISVTSDAAWRALAALLPASSGASSAEFTQLEQRLAAQDELDAMIAGWTKSHDADELMRLLQRHGVAAGVVRSLVEGLSDPQLVARGWFQELEHPDLGTHKYNGFLWRFRGRELVNHWPPPRLGEHSENLLRGLLKLDPAEIERLKASEVTGAVM
jgi:crotonobetainyl-CoA:carnitine CoA-transferase CaiB-like acyl-CoA transferase